MSLTIYKYFERQITFFSEAFAGQEGLLLPFIEDSASEVDAIVESYTPGRTGFNPAISWQYAIFLYKLSNKLYKAGVSSELLSPIFSLNKMLNGIDIFYEIEMPKNFLLGHTLGSVFAKAEYGEFCVFHHGCTVGQKNYTRPSLGEGVVMYPGSMIIGDCKVRSNTVLAPGVRLVDSNTPGDCYVFEDGKGGVKFKELTEFHADKFFSNR